MNWLFRITSFKIKQVGRFILRGLVAHVIRVQQSSERVNSCIHLWYNIRIPGCSGYRSLHLNQNCVKNESSKY